MSEKSKKSPNNRPNYTARRISAAALAASGLLALVGETVNAATHRPGTNPKAREYIVRQGDTESEVAAKAFPSQADNPESMFNLESSIYSQLPHNEAHQHGMLQPGDRLIFSPQAKIGEPTTYERAVKDVMSRQMVPPVNSPDFQSEVDQPQSYWPIGE